MSVNRRARLLSMLHVMDVSRQPQKPSNLGGADPDLIASNQTVLSHAAKAGHAEICEFLLSRYNVKVDSRNIRPQPNLLDPNAVWCDNTPLLNAVWNNCDEAVKIFLDDPRVDVNFIISKEQMTALMQAELQEYRSIANLLLTHGADPDLPHCTGMTPRMIREIPREQWRVKRNEYSERLNEVMEARCQAEKSNLRDLLEATRARMRARRAARAAEHQNPSSQVE
ncbi:unnamed protein product [Aspergillus oryzae]|nr:unnamed protein product [Aspergillus oryzae]GMF96078.1 unnamed protein product [Aspergillus oryzae]